MKLIRLFVCTTVIVCLTATFCYAQSTRVYKAHEVIELVDGLKVEVLRSRGEGDAKEWDVIYYREKRQTGKRMWQLASILLEEENEALLAKGIKPAAPTPISNPPLVDTVKKPALVTSEKSFNEKILAETKMPETFKSGVPKKLFTTLPSATNTTIISNIKKEDSTLVKSFITKRSKGRKTKKATDSTAYTFLSDTVTNEGVKGNGLTIAEFKHTDTDAPKGITTKARRSSRTTTSAGEIDSAVVKPTVTVSNKRRRTKKNTINIDSIPSASFITSDVAKSNIETKNDDSLLSKPIAVSGKNKNNRTTYVRRDSAASKPLVRRLTNREKIRLADSLLAAIDAASIKAKPTVSTDTHKTSTAGVFKVNVSSPNIVRPKSPDTILPPPFVVTAAEQVKVAERIADDTISESVIKPYDNIVVPPPTADERKEAAILNARTITVQDTAISSKNSIQAQATADTLINNVTKRKRYKRNSSHNKRSSASKVTIASKPAARKGELKRK